MQTGYRALVHVSISLTFVRQIVTGTDREHQHDAESQERELSSGCHAARWAADLTRTGAGWPGPDRTDITAPSHTAQQLMCRTSGTSDPSLQETSRPFDAQLSTAHRWGSRARAHRESTLLNTAVHREQQMRHWMSPTHTHIHMHERTYTSLSLSLSVCGHLQHSVRTRSLYLAHIDYSITAQLRFFFFAYPSLLGGQSTRSDMIQHPWSSSSAQ